MTKLFRYYDKVTGKERGICYSDKNGNPINNPDWLYEEIQEKNKQFYIDKQKQEQDAEPKPKTLEERIVELENKITNLEKK